MVEIEFESVEPRDWHELGSWPAFVLGPEFWLGDYFANEWNEYYGFALKTLCFFDGESNKQFIDSATIEKLESRFKGKEKQFFSRLSRAFKENAGEIEAARDEFARLPQNERARFLEKRVFRVYARNAVFDWTAFIYDQLEHDQAFKEYSKARSGVDGAALEFAELLTPAVETATLREQTSLIENALILKAKTQKRVAAQLSREMAREYGFLPVFHCNEPRDASEYERELLAASERRSEKELARELAEVKKTLLSAKRAQQEIEPRLLQALRDKIEALRACAEIRSRSDELVSEIGLLFRQAFKPLGDAANVGYKDLFFLTSAEALDFALHGTLEREKIMARKRGFTAFLSGESKWVIETSENARKTVGGLAASKESKSVALKGFAASPGLVTGKARIVFNASKANLVEGEVLVAPQTTIDFVPLMRKATAIVTDKGGLTSHAAIVARELGVPCVVGTKNATREFKNGDLIEVDASLGVVKLVKRQS